MCAVLVWITGLLVGVRQDPKRRQNHREGTVFRAVVEDECFPPPRARLSKKSQPRTLILQAAREPLSIGFGCTAVHHLQR